MSEDEDNEPTWGFETSAEEEIAGLAESRLRMYAYDCFNTVTFAGLKEDIDEASVKGSGYDEKTLDQMVKKAFCQVI